MWTDWANVIYYITITSNWYYYYHYYPCNCYETILVFYWVYMYVSLRVLIIIHAVMHSMLVVFWCQTLLKFYSLKFIKWALHFMFIIFSKLLSKAYNVLVLKFFSYSSTGPDKAGVNVIGVNQSFSCTHWFVAKCKWQLPSTIPT